MKRLSDPSGVTLVEVLVALAVLALVGAALASVQLSALRSGRAAQVRQVAAAALAQELLHQRLAAEASPSACRSAHLQHGWGCEVTLSCPAAQFGCELQLVTVIVSLPENTPLGGAPLEGLTVRYGPLLEHP